MTTSSRRSPRRRTMLALAIILVILLAFVLRLVDIQVVNAKENTAHAMAYGMGVTQTLTGTRGSIVDTDGRPLATSIVHYECQFSPENVGTVRERTAKGAERSVPWSRMSDRIAAIVHQTGAQVRATVSDALVRDPHSQYALLASGLSTQQYRELMELGTDFISCTSQPARTYPDGAVAGNLVGFVGGQGQPLGGLELGENSCLAPHDGTMTFQRGKDGVIIPGTETEKPAVNGGTLKLTIDADLQWYMQQLAKQAQQTLKAKFATVTVMDVHNGDLRAAAEYPTVDPNDIDAPGTYLNSHIFDWTFEPGSTFKAITASALIDAGGLTPTSTDGLIPWVKHFPNGAVVNDAFEHPPYDYTLAGVLMDSSNVGASTFSQEISDTTRYDYMKKFGIGSGSAINFLGQMHGDVHQPQNWSNQTRYDTAYGQGVTTTIPELLGVYDTIANDGVKIPLRLVQSCTKADGTVVTPKLPAPTRVIKTSTAKDMQKILENVALQSPDYANLVKIPGYNIAVKSGTGQIAQDGHYIDGLYYTTMIGFAPAEHPQYLVAVTLDEPQTVKSSVANAPIFTAAMTQVLKTYRVMPTTDKPTMLPKFG